MNILNVEIKARITSSQSKSIKKYLDNHSTESKGIDHQSDYYFKCPHGRLKLRIGNIENSLIYYEREEVIGLKSSKVILHKIKEDPHSLLDILKKTNSVLAEVHKNRNIFFIDNIKFHIDSVKSLGNFLEIEAISENDQLDISTLKKQCNKYMKIFNIDNGMLVDKSYSDMV